MSSIISLQNHTLQDKLCGVLTRRRPCPSSRRYNNPKDHGHKREHLRLEMCLIWFRMTMAVMYRDGVTQRRATRFSCLVTMASPVVLAIIPTACKPWFWVGSATALHLEIAVMPCGAINHWVYFRNGHASSTCTDGLMAQCRSTLLHYSTLGSMSPPHGSNV